VVKFYDIPKVHCYNNKNSERFFEALSSSPVELFENKGIQAIIDFKWSLIQNYTVSVLFFPYIIYLGLYFGYSNFIFVDRFYDENTSLTKEDWELYDYVFFVIGPLLIAFAIYFQINEFI